MTSRSLVEEFFVDEPIGGGLYPIQPGDTIFAIAQRVLYRAGGSRLRPTHRQQVEYVHILSSAPLNQAYASSSCSNAYPAELLVPGTGLGLHAAFFPIHESARGALEAGRLPARACDLEGNPFFPRIGRCLGTLYLPPVHREPLVRSGLVELVPAWATGGTTLDLPPGFYEQVKR